MSYPQGPLQGHVYYEEPLQGGVVYTENPFKRILRGVGGVLKDIGGRVAEHAPEILQGVATGLAMSQLGRSGGSQVDYTNNLDYGTRQSSYSPMTMPSVQPIPMREIPQYKPSTLGRDTLRQAQTRRQAYEPPRYTPPSNPLSSLLNQSNVTPTHQSRQSVQQTPSADWRGGYQNQSSGMLARALDPNLGRDASSPVQEDWTQVQHHLSHARRPVTQAEINAIRQRQQLVNTRPLNESPALHQMIMRSNEVRSRDRQSVQKQPPPPPHDKAYLNRRQEVLNKLFGGKVFDRNDMQFPYGVQGGQKVDDRNIQQMAAVADWIMFGQRTDGRWPDHKVKTIEDQLNMGGRNVIPPEIQRQLEIARQLNDILKKNEAVSIYQDDAKALAQGMKVLIDANTRNGKVDEVQLIADIQLFTIDSAQYEMGRLTGQAKQSNAAYNLFAGPRIGTIGWKEKYWDFGQQYSPDGRLVNQAHHFTFFFLKAIEYKGDPVGMALLEKAAYLIDMDNPQDRALANLAIELGKQINDGKNTWTKLPETIYKELKD